MNAAERRMVEVLKRGQEVHGIVSLKGEFEAEGARLEEMLRLAHIAAAANVPLTIKIGGPEAVRDLRDAKNLGARFIVAPMVETAYALQKYSLAVSENYREDELCDTDFLFNVETETSLRNLPALCELAIKSPISGMVFGRVDYAGSIGSDRSVVDEPHFTQQILEASRAARESGLEFVVGGAISHLSLVPLRTVAEIWLSRFETRKIVFPSDVVFSDKFGNAMETSLEFELLWLQNKQTSSLAIAAEDSSRIEMLRARLNQ